MKQDKGREFVKTSLTLEMEEALYYYCRENSDIVVEEVVMPDDHGIVDTLSCRLTTENTFEWRCYELKVSLADFRSKAKLSFIGNYNYFVLPKSLYEKVKDQIAPTIGVLVYHAFLEKETGKERVFQCRKETPTARAAGSRKWLIVSVDFGTSERSRQSKTDCSRIAGIFNRTFVPRTEETPA